MFTSNRREGLLIRLDHLRNTMQTTNTAVFPANVELVEVAPQLLTGVTLTRTSKLGVPYKNNTSRLLKVGAELRRFIANVQFSSNPENPRRVIATIDGVKYNIWISNFNGIPLIFAKSI